VSFILFLLGESHPATVKINRHTLHLWLFWEKWSN